MTVRRSDGGRPVGHRAVRCCRPSGDRSTRRPRFQFGIRGWTPGKWGERAGEDHGWRIRAVRRLFAADGRRVGRRAAHERERDERASWALHHAGGLQSSLRGTRFPAMVSTGPVTRRIVWAAASRPTSTLLRRGDPGHDRSARRAAADHRSKSRATAPSPICGSPSQPGCNNRLALGLGLHRLTGSTRVFATRLLCRLSYRSTTARDEVAYGGNGRLGEPVFDVTVRPAGAGWSAPTPGCVPRRRHHRGRE